MVSDMKCKELKKSREKSRALRHEEISFRERRGKEGSGGGSEYRVYSLELSHFCVQSFGGRCTNSTDDILYQLHNMGSVCIISEEVSVFLQTRWGGLSHKQWRSSMLNDAMEGITF